MVMGDEDKKVMDLLIEERVILQKEIKKMKHKLFEVDRRIHLLINKRVKNIDGENSDFKRT